MSFFVIGGPKHGIFSGIPKRLTGLVSLYPWKKLTTKIFKSFNYQRQEDFDGRRHFNPKLRSI